jgi:hypothetical protein
MVATRMELAVPGMSFGRADRADEEGRRFKVVSSR